MKRLLLLLTLLRADAATVSVCNAGFPTCTTNNLQTALDSLANCGDTITVKYGEIRPPVTIKARGCAGGTSRITVISDRSAWLPLANTRTTPSHLGNYATVGTSTSGSSLSTVLTAGVPANHWTFRGIYFTSSFSGTTFNLVSGVDYVAASNAEIADDIIFDQCIFGTPLPNGTTNVRNAIFGGFSNLVVKNSFFMDAAEPGHETHAILNLTTPGPVNVSNNFFVTSSMPMFTGGAITDYPVTPSNLTYEYNYSWRPWKYNNDPAQPFYADFLTNGSYHPCNKNHGETKFGTNIIWRYNGNENSWTTDQCFSQYNGYTNTLRTFWIGSFQNVVAMGTMSFTDTTHVVWNGATYTVPTTIPNGSGAGNTSNLSYGICVDATFAPVSGIICRPFTSFNNGTKTITTSVAFPSAPVGNFDWWIVYDGEQHIDNILIEKNIYKNVSTGMSSLAQEPANGVGNAGKLTGSVLRNNLIWNYNPYMYQAFGDYALAGFRNAAAEEGFVSDSATYTTDHNTAYSSVGIFRSFFTFNEVNNATIYRQTLWDTWIATNNLFGPGAQYPFIGSGTAGNTDLTLSTYTTNSQVKNNGAPGMGAGACTGTNTCTGNISTAWASSPYVDALRGDFTVKPTSVYYNAGLDVKSLGADPATLPIIKYPYVTLKTNAAELNVDLSPPIADALNTQPCVLEVSTSRNLISDLNTYSVVPTLDPTFFKQADSSAASNPLLANAASMSGSHLVFPIGKNASSVLGDDGLTHDLRLTAGTVYYYRLMCYGDTIMGSFTSASPSPRLRISGKVRLSGLVRLN